MFSTQAPSLPQGELTGGAVLASFAGPDAQGGPAPLSIGPVSPGDGIEGRVIPLPPPPGAPPSPAPGQGGFFDVLGSLLSQLDGILGMLLGQSNIPGQGGTTEIPAPPRSGI